MKKWILKTKRTKVNIHLKKSRPISRILSPINWSLIIYLDHALLHDSSCLPFNIGRVALILITQKLLIYLTFHRIEFTWFHYSIICTYFLLHWSSPFDGRVLSAMLLFGVRTFLSRLIGNDKAVCVANLEFRI